MSLVICSNQDADGQSERQRSSVFKPWSFRNTLSSTYEIPADAQVALQSCKVNIDGRIVVSKSNSKFYQYFGQKLNLDGFSSPQSSQTTSYPVFTDFLQDNEDDVLEVSVDDFANVVRKAIRETTYHPNVKEQPNVTVLRNASSLDFLGYKITYDQNTTVTNTIPANGQFQQWFRDDGVYNGDETIFSYTSGVFQRETAEETTTCVGICPSLPMNNLTGSMVVNISGTTGRANASGVEWHVGLSRYINNTDQNGYYYPSYTDYVNGGADATTDTEEEFFADFAIARDTNGKLVCYQNSFNESADGLIFEEVNYWDNANSGFSGAGPTNLSGVNFTDVKFEIEGERVRASIYDAGKAKWVIITEYSPTEPKESYFKPVNQACWALHPVLAIGEDTGKSNCTLEITTFNGVSLTDYDPKVPYKGGWFETMELLGADRLCRKVEARTILDTEGATYAQVGLNASSGLLYDNVLILQESEIYKVTAGANAGPLLGFKGSIIDTPSTIVNLNKKSYDSVFAPDLTSSLSMFVRLNNFGQSCINARTGNRSRILAHLTDLESKSGRNTYEPSNLIWLDLNNPAPLHITEFDISFCYVNEQYATILSGQSIVALYIRKKPKEMM